MRSGTLLKCDFKSARSVEPFGYLAQMLPRHQKLGHSFVWELVLEGTELEDYEETQFLDFQDVHRAKRILGEDVPFVVSCYGVMQENLTPELARTLAKKVVGTAEVINFNLPEGENVSVTIAYQMWKEFGLVKEIKIHSASEQAFWDGQSFPYLGLTDDITLSTSVRSDPY